MNTIYNPTYELVSYNNIPFMVAVDTYPVNKYDPHTDREYEEDILYVESVLVGGHEFVHLLTEEVVDDLMKLVTSE
jgi:hypothetical protein